MHLYQCFEYDVVHLICVQVITICSVDDCSCVKSRVLVYELVYCYVREKCKCVWWYKSTTTNSVSVFVRLAMWCLNVMRNFTRCVA